METSEIISRIQSGLKITAQNFEVPFNEIQIKITNSTSVFDSVKFYPMRNGNTFLSADQKKDLQIDVKQLLELDSVKSMILLGFLKNTFASLAKKNNLDSKTINARIFTTNEDFTPRVNLYEGEKVIKEITVEELTSK